MKPDWQNLGDFPYGPKLERSPFRSISSSWASFTLHFMRGGLQIPKRIHICGIFLHLFCQMCHVLVYYIFFVWGVYGGLLLAVLHYPKIWYRPEELFSCHLLAMEISLCPLRISDAWRRFGRCMAFIWMGQDVHLLKDVVAIFLWLLFMTYKMRSLLEKKADPVTSWDSKRVNWGFQMSAFHLEGDDFWTSFLRLFHVSALHIQKDEAVKRCKKTNMMKQ